jgi:hypothetical protein
MMWKKNINAGKHNVIMIYMFMMDQAYNLTCTRGVLYFFFKYKNYKRQKNVLCSGKFKSNLELAVAFSKTRDI